MSKKQQRPDKEIKFQEYQFDPMLKYPSRSSFYDTTKSRAVPMNEIITRELIKDDTMVKVRKILIAIIL